MKILMTGGTGLLGSEIRKTDPAIVALGSSGLDITDPALIATALDTHRPDVVLHLAAITNPPLHEKDPEPGIRVNIVGTANVALACHQRKLRLVYTSSDYLYTGRGPHLETESVLPPSKFYWSKLGGEAAVAMLNNYLILRLSFGPRPFPYDKVYADQYSSKLYVDEMAPLIVAAAKSDACGVMNLGGPKISLEDYARLTKPEIETIPRPDWVPRDLSLDLTKMKKELNLN